MQNRGERDNTRMKKRKKYSILSKFFFILAIVILLFGVIKIWMPSFEKIPFYEYFSFLDENEMSIVINDEFVNVENSPVYKDNEIYIPIDVISQYIDEYIFWDEYESKITITDSKKVIRMKTEDLTYYVNNEPMELSMPLYEIDGIAYMPIGILTELYNVSFFYDDSVNIITLNYTDENSNTAKIISKKAIVRYEPDKKSPITTKILKDEEILTYDIDGEYTKIRTSKGLVGWVLTKNIGEHSIIEPSVVKEEDTNTELWEPSNGKINMVFDQVTTVKANKNDNRRIIHNGLDVLSPTWFSFSDTNGTIKNIADKSYVDWAHSNGYQVWALITDNFDSDVSHGVISSTETREKVIKQLLAYVSLYNLDGINIDFENVPSKDGKYFIQFIRELTPFLHEQGVVISVDTYVPKPWTEHYNRNELGKIVDYVIVMGYDEHAANSDTSGSVASIGWSKEAIESTLEQGVPEEKLILGIPFYTRIWTEENKNGNINVVSKSTTMQAAFDFMNEKNAEIKWLDDKAQYYAEVTEGNKTYKVWFEEERSIEEKLKLVNEYDIAGSAGWKRGLEKDEIWPLLKEYLKK